MKKVLAYIVEYKLNNSGLFDLIYKIRFSLEDYNSTHYPTEFETKMKVALNELQILSNHSSHNHDAILDILEEMEFLIVDYLSNLNAVSTDHCFFI